MILDQEPEVVGLTTMCNSYPQTLALARECRALDPTVKIVLGGPQATVVDLQTMERFGWCDAIVRNEADSSPRQVLGRWAGGDDLEGVPGVTWRRPDDAIVRNVDAPLPQDLDSLPYPAFDRYPLDQVQVGLAPIEAGRGCPYACTFCSTNEYFNRRYRIKSPQRLIAEMSFLHEQYGVDRFDLVHDMLTVDRRWVQKFCHALLDGGCEFRWGCSARVDRVDDALSEMAAAGCVGIFFGVETGSQRMQSLVHKHLELDRVMPVMRTCINHDMAPTGSFIIGFPDETIDDAFDSFHMALDILQCSPRTQAQMHLLAPLVGSPLYVTLTRAFQLAGWERPLEAGDGPSVSDVGDLLSRSGVVEEVRALALTFFNRAESTVDDMAQGSWLAAIRHTRERVASFQFHPAAEAAPAHQPRPAGAGSSFWNGTPGIVVPVARAWRAWLDRTREPRVAAASLVAEQQRVLHESGAASTVGTALCQVGLAIHASMRRFPEQDLAAHVGMSAGELEWCRRNDTWLKALLALSIDYPPELWTVADPVPPGPFVGWVPPAVGRYLGYRMVAYCARAVPGAAQPTVSTVLEHHRRHLVA